MNLQSNFFDSTHLPIVEINYLHNRIRSILDKLDIQFDYFPNEHCPIHLMDLLDHLESRGIVFTTILEKDVVRMTCWWVGGANGACYVRSGRGVNLVSAFCNLMLDTTPGCIFDKIESGEVVWTAH